MAFCVDERKLKLTELQSFLTSCSTKIAHISDKLGWSKNIGKVQELVHCPLKEEHRVPKATLSDHIARCRWKQEGYTEDDLPLSDPAAGSSGTATRSIFTAWRGAQDDRPAPRTVDRYLSDFTVEERRAMYDYTVSKTASVSAVKIEDLTSMFHKVDRPRAKTKLERLAEERDAKRKRVSERSRKVHTNRKSRTEILREVIMNQMELYEEWVKHTSEIDPTTEYFESRLEPPAADKTNGGSYADLGSLHEGDIILSSSGRNAVLSQTYKWDDGTVPYVFHHSYESSEKEKVLSAMRQLEAGVPCIRFVPRVAEAEYVEIGKRKELGCAAMVGCQRGHAHIVNYRPPECFQSAGIIQHELLHVLGLLHEQSRPDRDEHVDILWDNIHKDYWNDFKKSSKNEFTTFDIPYDYKSIMHYPRNAFSKNGNDTIVAKTNPKLDLGQRDHPTENDLEKVRRMYNCSNVLPTVEIK